MNEDIFWEVVSLFDWKKSDDYDTVLKPGLKKLISMKSDDIQQFAEILAEKLYDLDGIEYASNIGEGSYKGDKDFFSVDSFLYARCYVVANGKDYYYSILNDPIKMPKDMEFEAILYLADEAYNEKTNTEDEILDTKFSYETFSNKEKWQTKN